MSIAEVAWDTSSCPPETLAQVMGVAILPNIDLDDVQAAALEEALWPYWDHQLEWVGAARSLLDARDTDWSSRARRLTRRWSTYSPLPRTAEMAHLLRAGAYVEHVEDCHMGHSAMGAHDCIGSDVMPIGEDLSEEDAVEAWQSMFESPLGVLFERRPGRHGFFLADGVLERHGVDTSAASLARSLHRWLQSWDWAELMLSETMGAVPVQASSSWSGRPWCLSVSKVRSETDPVMAVTLAVDVPVAVAATMEAPSGSELNELRLGPFRGVSYHRLADDPDDVLTHVLELLEVIGADARRVSLTRRALTSTESAHTRAYVARSRRGEETRWVLTQCLKCDRDLTDGISAARGYGPECWRTLRRHELVDIRTDARWHGAVTGQHWLAEVTERLVSHLIGRRQRGRDASLVASARAAGRVSTRR